MDRTASVPAQMRGARAKRAWLALVAVIAILGLAWFDGGEEALHPISQEVAIPELSE